MFTHAAILFPCYSVPCSFDATHFWSTADLSIIYGNTSRTRDKFENDIVLYHVKPGSIIRRNTMHRPIHKNYTVPASFALVFSILTVFYVPHLHGQSPAFKVDTAGTVLLNVNSDAGFSVRGLFGSGTIPATGSGTRLMWYPRKAAFRAGWVSGTEWDDANIGQYSTALGFNTIASSDYANAFGFSCTAGGTSSTAMGYLSHASGNFATAIGTSVTASGNLSSALGSTASTNSFTGAFVIGDNSTATVMNATAQNQMSMRFDGGYRLFTNPFLTNGFFISGSGDVGIGQSSPGARLEVAGQVKITGGTPAAGKVLTSDAAGLASWTVLPASGCTLDAAYDFGGPGAGRTINADTGAVRITGSDGFLVSGTPSNGAIPATGAGTRMMFYPNKSAFRAGAVTGSRWDDANIGSYSTAFGYQTLASGEGSLAAGNNTTASGVNSAAFGYSTNANAYFSSAFGRYNVGGGSTGAWVDIDPLFEIGNGTNILGANALTVLKNGNVGIGTAHPDAQLHISGYGAGILAEGVFGVLGTLSPGAGTRLHWYSRKAAFRAGRVDGTQWDDASIGNYSSSLGMNTTASGNYSVAIGTGCTASGASSVAMGYSTLASADNATAFGYQSIASGRSATASGESVTASGTYSLALGYSSIAGGNSSVALGNQNYAPGDYSLALGHFTHANGDFSTAMGWSSTAEGDFSLSSGYVSQSLGIYSTSIGIYTVASGDRSTAMGRYVNTNGKNGSFCIGDASRNSHTFSTAANQMLMRFDGGYRLYTNSDTSTGVYMNNGAGSWSSISDRNRKENFAPVDGESILRSIRRIPIARWNYKGNDPSVQYIGPVAQDFWQAFKLGGTDSLGISTLAMDGVNMAAIQALEKRTAELKASQTHVQALAKDLKEKTAEIGQLKKEIGDLSTRLLRMEQWIAERNRSTGEHLAAE